MQLESRGSLYTITVRAGRDELAARIQELRPIFYEVLPLTLEEIFISETEARGYDIKKLLF
jgi:ABC-2 type transport system ATP-binding protein